jgi:hypothetical protein
MDDMIPLDDVCKEYFHLSPKIARRKAALGMLPIAAVRLSGGRKGPFFVLKADLEAYVQERISKAQELNSKMRLAGAL